MEKIKGYATWILKRVCYVLAHVITMTNDKILIKNVTLFLKDHKNKSSQLSLKMAWMNERKSFKRFSFYFLHSTVYTKELLKIVLDSDFFLKVETKDT